MKSKRTTIPNKSQKDPENTNSHSNQAENKKNNWYKKLLDKWGVDPADRVVVSFTGAIALCTLFYVLVSAFQLCALLDSNKINRESLVSVQRAFISFKGIHGGRQGVRTAALTMGSEHHFENGKWVDMHTPVKKVPSVVLPAWDMDAILENSGTTPAVNVISKYFAEVRDKEPSINDFRFDEQKTVVARTIGPKAVETLATNHPVLDVSLFVSPFNADDFTKTFVNPKFFIWGLVAYRDIFSDTKWHLTEFCSHLLGIRKPAEGGIDFIYTGCAIHNCADKNCSDYDEITKPLTKLFPN